MYIDTHCHYNDPRYDGELDAVIAKSVQAGVGIMIQADICAQERPSMLAIADRYPGVIYPMAGLYPGNADENWEKELELVKKTLDERKDIVAIGETGLDYHEGTEMKAFQKDAFRAQLELASKRGLPVNIHLRDATEDFFDILESCRGMAVRGNLHAFSGSAGTFRRLGRYGEWYVGIGGVLTFKNAGIAEAVREIPLEAIVLETDSPYLAPTPFRGTRNDSSNIPVIAEFLAGRKGVPASRVEEQTSANALKLFDRIGK